MLKNFVRIIIRLIGWQADYKLPEYKKYVLVGAPHTSNWDFPMAILFFLSTGLRFNWVGKQAMFFWPFAGLFQAMGGIPINRKASAGFIEQSVTSFAEREAMILTIAPEGTRSYTKYWRTGFYYIALQAKVPIALGYVDYTDKRMGIGKTFMPSGDIEQDMQIIRAFYADIDGKDTSKQGPVIIKTE